MSEMLKGDRDRPEPPSEVPPETSAFAARYREAVDERREGWNPPVDRLFSPAQVVVATLLFGPVGGSSLVALNCKRLDNPAGGFIVALLGAGLTPVTLLLAMSGGLSGGFAALTIWVLVALLAGHLVRVTQGAETSGPYREDSWGWALLLPLVWSTGAVLALVLVLLLLLANSNMKW